MMRLRDLLRCPCARCRWERRYGDEQPPRPLSESVAAIMAAAEGLPSDGRGAAAWSEAMRARMAKRPS